MSDNPQPPPGADPAGYERWREQAQRRQDITACRRRDGKSWDEVMAELGKLPPETAEERAERERRRAESGKAERLARFRRVCPEEFRQKINPKLLINRAAFERVAAWDGKFPGPIATGPTGTAKTRAAWSALGRLCVGEQRNFVWFPVKRLITEFIRYESKDLADEFWRNNRGYHALFVDDIDKINAQFESELAALFQFYDWVYREHRPCITTTNKDRSWWANLMGDAFARRLFDDAHTAVKF